MNTITLPNVGDTIKIKYVPGITNGINGGWTIGAIGTVTKVNQTYSYRDSKGNLTNGPVVWVDVTKPDTGSNCTYYVSEWEPFDASTAPVAEDIEAILRRELDTAKTDLNRIMAQAQDAIATIGEALVSEANDRGWCSEYDNIIDKVNDRLPDWLQLPQREAEYEVTWVEYYSVSIRRSQMITARTPDDAIEIAREIDDGPDIEEFRNAYYNGDFECTDSVDWDADPS